MQNSEVVDANGDKAELVAEQDEVYVVRVAPEQHLAVPCKQLAQDKAGTWRLAGRLSDYAAISYDGTSEAVTEVVLPLAEEQLRVRKASHETRVQVHKHVLEREETIRETVSQEEVEVRRVAVNRVVDEVPQTRQEGETTIIPVLEERLVVRKELVLKEEIHLIRQRTEEAIEETVRLRAEEAEVEQITPPGGGVHPGTTTADGASKG